MISFQILIEARHRGNLIESTIRKTVIGVDLDLEIVKIEVTTGNHVKRKVEVITGRILETSRNTTDIDFQKIGIEENTGTYFLKFQMINTKDKIFEYTSSVSTFSKIHTIFG